MTPTARSLRWIPGLLAVAALGTGCLPAVYVPTQQATPMLREAGEIQATLSSTSLEASYAVAPQVLVHAAGFYRNIDNSDIQRAAGAWLGEAGAGMFGDLILRDVRWTALAGVGGGRTWWALSDANPRSYEANAVRGFVQPNIGWVTPYFELVGSVRLSGVKYLDFASSGFSPDETARLGFEEANVTGPVWFFVEPAVTAKVGYRWVKLFAQYRWTEKLSPGALAYERAGLSIGVSVDLAKWHGDWDF